MKVWLGFILVVQAHLVVADATTSHSRFAGLYSEQCAVCHGDKALGNKASFSPRLAGQNAAYLREQLMAFQIGKRGTHADDVHGQSMRVFATSLSQYQVDGLSAYLAGLGATDLDQVPSGNDLGSTLYRENCATCHGQYGQGFESIFVPKLSNLSSWYLDAQLQAYEKGWRGGAHSSTRAKNMRAISGQLKYEHERRAVVKHISREPDSQ